MQVEIQNRLKNYGEYLCLTIHFQDVAYLISRDGWVLVTKLQTKMRATDCKHIYVCIYCKRNGYV